jgi:hypothetical protein
LLESIIKKFGVWPEANEAEDKIGVDEATAIAMVTRSVLSIAKNFYQDNDSF